MGYRYRRLVLKLGGEAISGPSGWGVAPAALRHLAGEVPAVHQLGIEVAVVVGGGEDVGTLVTPQAPTGAAPEP